MKRPLLYWSLILVSINISIRQGWFIFLALVGSLILVELLRRKMISLRFVVVILISAIASRGSFLLAEKEIGIAKGLVGKELTVTGKLSTIKTGEFSSTSIIDRVLDEESKRQLPKARISWDKKIEIKNFSRLTARVRVLETKRARNQGNFDEEIYLKSQGIHLKFKVLEVYVIDFSSVIDAKLSQVYNYMVRSLNSIEDKGVASLYKTIIIGAKDEKSTDLKEAFNVSGVSHLLVVSGLHLTIIANLIYLTLQKLYLPKRFSVVIVTLILLVYLILSGIGISAIRAFFMYVSLLISLVTGRTYDRISSLCMIFGLTLIAKPYILDYLGFILSYSVVGFICINQSIIAIKNKVLNIIANTGLLAIMMTPLLVYYFYKISPYTVVANLILIPFFALVILLGILSILTGIFNNLVAQVLLNMGGVILKFYIEVTEFIASLPYAQIVVGKLSAFRLLVCYLIIFAGIILMKNYKTKKLVIVCILAYFLFFVKNDTSFLVSAIDVGQGDSLLIQDNSLNILVDSGSVDINEVGRYRLMPTLDYKGIDKIDYAFLSHMHKDHYSGLLELMDKNRLRRLVVSYYGVVNEAYIKLMNLAKKKGVEVFYMGAGDRFQIRDLKLTCLHPFKDYRGSNPNSFSQTILVEKQGFRILLTGDLERDEEELLVENSREFLKADLLKVAHHGSKTSTSKGFLDAVSPKYAIISCGVDNKFNHPSKKVLDRLLAENIDVDVTSKTGQVEYRFDDGNIDKRVWNVNKGTFD